ncbi:CHASE2 domain-containing protein [Maridesulfovibrio zosterae]|uniref:CHASE2 domain-containing protein n=1 Tax=Maridesulfovibrio zosterae TaxID=82171 RepID=UPI000415B0C7|nr:CHASE2 domain-containing protein [Maridesulfovibrio zosterae]
MKLKVPDFIKQLLRKNSADEKDPFFRNILKYNLWPARTKRLFILNVFFGFVLLVILELLPLSKVGQNMINDNHDFLISESFKQNAREGKTVNDDIELVLLDRTFYETSPSMGYWTPKLRLNETLLFILDSGAKVVVIDCRLDRAVPDDKENDAFLINFKQSLEKARQTGAVIIIPRLALKNGERPTSFSTDFWMLADKYKDVLKVGDAGIIRNPEDKRIRHLRYYRVESGKEDKKVLLSISLLAALYDHGAGMGDEHRNRIIQSILEIENGQLDSKRIEIFHDTWIKFFPQKTGSDDIEARLKFILAPRKIYINKIGYAGAAQSKHVQSATGIRFRKPESFKGKLVIIGSDYEDIGDMHLTPIGRMPGVYIIVNAVNMFLNGDQVHADAAISYLIKIITVLVVSLGVAHLPAIFDLLLLILAYMAFRPLSAYLFIEHGLFFNSLLLLAGISFFDYVNNVSEYVIERFLSLEE